MSLSLASVLSEAALRRPDRTAVILGEERISYAELWEQTRRYAAALREHGIGRADRVALLMPNVPDFPRAYYAIVALGAVVVPVHALLTASEIAHILRDSHAAALICGGALLEAGAAGASEAGCELFVTGTPVGMEAIALDRVAAGMEPISVAERRAAGDDAVVLYTSGTTGKPKGAVLSQENLVLNCTIVAHELFRLTPDDVVLGCLPLFHSFGQTCAMNAAFRNGATLVLLPRFEGAAALQLMIDRDVTVFAGVPTMYIALLDAAKQNARKPNLRIAVSGGSSLPLVVLEAFEREFAVPIYEGYGLSETSPVASFNQPDLGRKPGTVGRGIWGVELAIARADLEDRIEFLPAGELGEIVIRGHCVFKGYLNNAEATRAAIVDGWFRSGDLGTMDHDGFISIVDRKKDMLLRGGYNVYPREVEEVLLQHPAIAQVAVIGVPHPELGEDVCAVIVAREPVSSEEIVEWSRSRLAKHKYPRRIEFIETLPLGPSGKVLKRELRARYSSRGGEA